MRTLDPLMGGFTRRQGKRHVFYRYGTWWVTVPSTYRSQGYTTCLGAKIK